MIIVHSQSAGQSDNDLFTLVCIRLKSNPCYGQGNTSSTSTSLFVVSIQLLTFL